MLSELDQHPIREFDAATLATTNPFHGDEDYAMTTDTSLPVIVVELKPGFDKLIDGTHRPFKALALHHPTVRAAGGIVQDRKVTPRIFRLGA